jgi:amino acid transporter
MESENYKKDSISLIGAISLGTGVMIGAGIFAILGQVAELSGSLLPFAFIFGAIVTGFSSYAYVKLSNNYPSAGGIAMYLMEAYGKGTITAAASLLMVLSMVISESLVARTFGTYTLQLFPGPVNDAWVPVLGVVLLLAAFGINLSGNKALGKSSLVMAIVKIGGISIFALGGLWLADFSFSDLLPSWRSEDNSIINNIGALALSILAYKGFTTITNSGEEVKEPKKNVGRAIIFSLLICAVIYTLVAWAVSVNLTVPEIIAAKDFALAEAAKPAFGKWGLTFTVALAIVATISGVIASLFAVSRMTTMLTKMNLIPHRHFGMSGSIQRHMLVYTVVVAIVLTVFFDLSRIASLGAILYLVMDTIVQWGVLKNLRNKIGANIFIVTTAIVLNCVVLAAFIGVKASRDPLVLYVALGLIITVFLGERLFLRTHTDDNSKK